MLLATHPRKEITMLTKTPFSVDELAFFSEVEVQTLDQWQEESDWAPMALDNGKAPSNLGLIIGSTVVLLAMTLGFVAACMATLGGHADVLQNLIIHLAR